MVRRTKIDHAEDWKILCSDTEKQCFETRKKERKKEGELKSGLKVLHMAILLCAFDDFYS